jgi:hypothetical protein
VPEAVDMPMLLVNYPAGRVDTNASATGGGCGKSACSPQKPSFLRKIRLVRFPDFYNDVEFVHPHRAAQGVN